MATDKAKSPYRNFGPALLVTAAFIGPGTVLTASKAGANYGFSLIWAVIFSILATIALQEMAARLGIITQGGLASAIRMAIKSKWGRFFSVGLVLGAILIGNAAYQTGNLLGAGAGLQALFPESDFHPGLIALLFGLVALCVIWVGRLELVKVLMMGLVIVMSVMFLYSAVACGPNWGDVCSAMVPSVPDGESWREISFFAIGLIGTTVVPYNLFLHASASAEQWKTSGVPSDKAIKLSRIETILSVGIGGLVTASILITMAVAFRDSNLELEKSSQIAGQLRESLGDWSAIVFGIGLCAAGLTSAITAPIAAGYATAGCFGWPCKLSDTRLKLVATAVVVTGILFASLNGAKSPLQIIILAQVANGLLLPLVAVFLLYVVNYRKLMGPYRNKRIANVFGFAVVAIAFVLAFYQLSKVVNNLLNF